MTVQKKVGVDWFSGFFGVNRPQYELPFVDFDLGADVPLYIDPYAITKDPSELGAKCHDSIISYFQFLLDTIRSGDKHLVRRLIHGRFREPFSIHLGVSKTARSGRGIGDEQELGIVDALTNSQAVKSGAIHAIQELELHIEGVGSDKISDLTANIILEHLAHFTEEVCDEYGIATLPTAVSGFWNPARNEWDGGHFNLPVSGTNSYILVPKRFVRKERDLMNHKEYYDKYALTILERELLDANDSLVQTLKNGKKRVYKKDIREDERFKISKQRVSQMIVEHPDTIEEYRSDLSKAYNPVDPGEWSGKADIDDPTIKQLLSELPQIQSGKKSANVYHDTVFALIEFVFDWALENFEKEFHMDQGRSRIDIIADNYASGSLFSEIRDELNATSIPMECKNYGGDLGNNEFNQLMERLGRKTSRFGILFCRSITDAPAMLKHQGDRWLRQDVLILLIDDELLKTLVEYRLERDFSAIDSLLRRMIRAVKFSSKTDGR